MKLRLRISSLVVNRLLTGLVLTLVLAIALAVWQSPVPHLAITFGETTIDVRADGAWSLGPGDCLQIRWVFDGELPIHVDGREWHESGEQQFCPTIFATSPTVELTDHRSGEYRSYRLNIFYLPEFLANLVGVAVIPVFILFGIQYLWINDGRKRPAFRVVVVATLILMLCITLVRLSGRELTIETMLVILRNLFSGAHWHSVGVLLAGLLYTPLVLQAMWQAIVKRPVADIVAVSCFMLFVVLLYLPFGFATVAQWDGWTIRAYLENMPWSQLHTELTARPLLFAPSIIANSISTESFIGFNVVYALLLCARSVILFGIFRQFNVRHLYAFLVTMLFIIYPVDSRLLSLQATNLQFSFVSLLTAIYLLLRYTSKPTRQYLIGTWLALSLCVGVYETAFGLIVVIPLLWWYRFRKMTTYNLNLTAIWYIIPASKLVYILFLLSARRSFYQSDFVYTGSEHSLSELVSKTIDKLVGIYQRTFVIGWGEAVNSIGQNPLLPLAIFLLGLIVFMVRLIWRNDKSEWAPENRQPGFALVTGLLLILPSVAILIWIDKYNNDYLGLYLYIPVPAAIALFCLITLLTSPIAKARSRNVLITIACMMLLLPGISRLFVQHQHYVTSADNKARILAQIVQLAPAIESHTRVLVLSEMSIEEFQNKHIEAFGSSALGHALYVIYEGQGSGRGSICPSVENCFPLLHRKEYLEDTIVFVLDRDLNLQLVEEPNTMLNEFVDLDYDVSRLYNPHAPVPSRAYTMLGSSKE